ncbi:MAG: hypothetical protein QXT68_03620 [Halobacteria archaeon]
MDIGDAILLRSGQTRVLAVGLVASGYQYLEQFDDVNGWDLRHGRRVRWFKLPKEYDFGRPVFGANPSRLSRIQDAEIRGYVSRIIQSPPQDWQTSRLPELPPVEPQLERVPERLAPVVAEAQDLAPLFFQNGEKFGDLPAEDEIIVHLVVPFLKALGWRTEQIAVQWRDIDVALFSKLPRTPENCRFVVEAKRVGSALEVALGQAKDYVERLLPNADFVRTGPGPEGIKIVPRDPVRLPDILLTDGFRYRLYASGENYRPVAYANLERLKQSSVDLFSRMRSDGGAG